jgi:hypothetical protein
MSVVIKDQFSIPEGFQITKCEPGVARGLKASDYVARKPGGGGGGSRAEPIASGDAKFDMYANALPAAIRRGVVEAGLDVRAMYKEYRLLGRDRLVEKYSHLKQEN